MRKRHRFSGFYLVAFKLGTAVGFLVRVLISATIVHLLFPEVPHHGAPLGLLLVGIVEATHHGSDVFRSLMRKMAESATEAATPTDDGIDDHPAHFERVAPTLDQQFSVAYVIVDEEDRIAGNRIFCDVKSANEMNDTLDFPTRIVALKITRLDRQA